MKSKFLKIASVGVLAMSLAACGSKVSRADYEKWAEENGYIKPVSADLPRLEVSFATFADAEENVNHIDYDALKTKFEGGYNFLLMLGDSECSTCAAVKTYLGNWVKANHYEVYYINELTGGSEAAKTWVKAKLGNPTTYPFLYAVKSANGAESEVVDTLTFSKSADASDEKIKPFIAKNFKLENDQFQATVGKFRNLAELRAAVAAGEKFILYVTRNSCPDCQKSADILRDDSLTVFFKNFKGKLYEIVSEEIIAEHKALNLMGTTSGEYSWTEGTNTLTSVYADTNATQIVTSTGLRTNANSYFKNWSDVQISEQMADAVASGAFDKATLQKAPKEFYLAAVNQLKASTEMEEVAGEAKLGMSYTSDEHGTMTVIKNQAILDGLASEHNVQLYQTKDDGTAFVRTLRSTPTVVASGYASIKNVVLSAQRATIYDAKGNAVGYKKTVSATANRAAYEVLAAQPADWAANYTKYYTYNSTDRKYNAVTGATAPTWAAGTYYEATGIETVNLGYTGTNKIAFKLGQELDDSAAIGGRASASAVEAPNYLYWYNMNPDNITPRDNNANACYNTPEYISRIQHDIIAWANSWLIDWSASAKA